MEPLATFIIYSLIYVQLYKFMVLT